MLSGKSVLVVVLANVLIAIGIQACAVKQKVDGVLDQGVELELPFPKKEAQ